MKENKKVLIVVIIILTILVVGLSSFIIIDKFIFIDKHNSNQSLSESENNSSVRKQKEINFNVNKNGSMLSLNNNYAFNDNFVYDEIDNIIYIINVNNKKIKIDCSNEYTIVSIDDNIIDKIFNSTNYKYILYNITKYNDYIFVDLGLENIIAESFNINLNENKLENTYCLPEKNGICSGTTFRNIIEENYLKIEYKINYNTDKKDLINYELINCEKYKNIKLEEQNDFNEDVKNFCLSDGPQ